MVAGSFEIYVRGITSDRDDVPPATTPANVPAATRSDHRQLCRTKKKRLTGSFFFLRLSLLVGAYAILLRVHPTFFF